MSNSLSLRQLGWQPFFQQQLTLSELEDSTIARVVGHHRNEYVLQLEHKQLKLPITTSLPTMTVGDWLLLDHSERFKSLLERKSTFKRKAAGTKVGEQLIAANLDTLFIVCSLNQDFNLSRIERYLSIAHEAMVEPVVILTKVDLCEEASQQKSAVQALDPMLSVEVINSLDIESVQVLKAWCCAGKTVSFVGSSGVGKSTLVNTLTGVDVQQTSGIREDDSKGRHTTRARSMHFMVDGAVLIDTPGMRELQLTDCEAGVSHTFADIEELITQCRFSNCHHQKEPGCAIQKAVELGSLDLRRFENYQKLQQEQARNSATLQQKRAKDKALSKLYRTVQADSRVQKKGY